MTPEIESNPEDIKQKAGELLADVPKSREIYTGDINQAVVRVQIITGITIDAGWWQSNVGNDGSTEEILHRFDDAYAKKYLFEHGIDMDQVQEMADIEVSPEAQASLRAEEEAWSSYRHIGSQDYEAANTERIKSRPLYVTRLEGKHGAVTLVASLKTDPETGEPLSGHAYRPEAQSMKDIETAFAGYLEGTPPHQRIVIYEGDQRIFTERDEAIRSAADSGLIQFLANQADVPAVSGELPLKTEAEILSQLGIDHQETLALFVARGLAAHMASDEADFLAGYINFQASTIGIEGFREFSEAEKAEFVANDNVDELKASLNKKVGELLPALNNLYRPALGNKDLLLIADDGNITINPVFAGNIFEVSLDKLGWSGDHRINEVAKIDMELRDRAVFHRVLDAYRRGKQPFVVYGGSHIVTTQPAFEQYLSKED